MLWRLNKVAGAKPVPVRIPKKETLPKEPREPKERREPGQKILNCRVPLLRRGIPVALEKALLRSLLHSSTQAWRTVDRQVRALQRDFRV
jgi:hypothetical protein